MLQLPKEQEPLRAAMILREDAIQMGVRLPVKVQLQLLDESLKAGFFDQVWATLPLSTPSTFLDDLG